MTILWNIPNQITQGDDIEWSQTLEDYNPATDTLSCFIRGASSLDLTGIPNGNQWDFTITSAQSQDLTPESYKTQFVIFKFGTKRKALGTTQLVVCQSFEKLENLETRSQDEIELDEVNKALAKGVKEYSIGDRRVIYHSLQELSMRQQYLRTRIAIASGKIKAGGRNVGIRFSN